MLQSGSWADTVIKGEEGVEDVSWKEIGMLGFCVYMGAYVR